MREQHSIRRFLHPQLSKYALAMMLVRKCFANECSVAIDQINQPELELYNATKGLLQTFNETCDKERTCITSVIPTDSLMTRNYTSLMGNGLDPMTDVCTNMGEDYNICFVTTEFKNGNKVLTSEINKPVCFPPSCSDTETDLLDHMCDSNEQCEIISREVHCPHMNRAFDTEKCKIDAATILSHRRYKRFSTRLHQSMVKECINAILQGSSVLCDVSTSLLVRTLYDFTGFEENEKYVEYEKTCAEYGGSSCKMSMSTQGKIESDDSFLSFHADVLFVDYPFCRPLECTDENITFIAKSILNSSGFDCFNADCDIHIESITCD